MPKQNFKLVFWGSSNFSVEVLDELDRLGITPNLVITTPDKPAGRKLNLLPTPVKIWSQEKKIPCLDPQKLNEGFLEKINSFKDQTIFLVASYGKIIPKFIIDLPEYQTLNIHPSLLPKYRGPSPLQYQILNNESEIGVSIMLIDEQVDHGPVIAKDKLQISNVPISFTELEKLTARLGAEIFAKILPDWMNNNIKAEEQDHSKATFTKKIEKSDGEIILDSSNAFSNYLKFLAFSEWPGIYFFQNNNKDKRVIIRQAEYRDSQFIIKKVLPAGKKEMSWEDFLRGQKTI